MKHSDEYVVLNDGETFMDLKGCCVVRLKASQGLTHGEDIHNGRIREAVEDRAVTKLSIPALVDLYDYLCEHGTPDAEVGELLRHVEPPNRQRREP